MPEFFDIACNLTHESIMPNIDDVITEAKLVNVNKLGLISAELEDFSKIATLVKTYPNELAPTYGVHPHHASQLSGFTKNEFFRLVSKYNPNVIGEIGLDYFRNISTPEEQMHAFEIQLQASIDLELPVFLHQRDSHDDFLKILRNYHSELSSLVVHCFTGTQRELDEYLELGSYIGLTGWICDERRNQELRASIKNIPLEKLMIETDAPYLIPRNLKPRPRKNINLPKYLPHIAAEISSLTNYSISEIATETYNNAIKFFNLT
jgi:TatD DNase family protein